MSEGLVQAYNPDWVSGFFAIRGFVEPALLAMEIAHKIHHVGSTAIPGMTAKPIIDLDVVVARRRFREARTALESLGYTYEGELGIQGRHAFDLRTPGCGRGGGQPSPNLPKHHLYVCLQNAEALLEHLAFRDFMRCHPKWVQRLSGLKRSLCEQHDNDRQAYIEGKDAMVREITRRALGSRTWGTNVL